MSIGKDVDFRGRVLSVVRTIPRGKTMTYRQVAAAAGRPQAARAVGNILNRIWQTDRGRTIPCHRVVRSDGSLGGYAGGADVKQTLLSKERYHSIGQKNSASYILHNLSKVYGDGQTAVTALAGINLTIPQGVFWAITGPSGSGKSTLMHLIGLLDRPTEGSITIGKTTITASSNLATLARLRREKIGFIFQQFFLLPRLSAHDNVVLPAIYTRRNLMAARQRAAELLTEVGLADRITHRPNQLSGGEQQRVAIARALINDPDIILADEPTGNLDSKTGTAILELVERLNQKGKTIILVTHDEQVAKRAEKIIRLEDGRLA